MKPQHYDTPTQSISRVPKEEGNVCSWCCCCCCCCFGNGGQFIACVKKHIYQKRRDACASILEFILPIIFIVGTVFIWLAFGISTEGKRTFIDYSNPGFLSQSNTYDFVRNNLCVNQTANPSGIGTLTFCQAPTFAAFSWRCFPPDPSVPVAGLCYNSNKTQFQPGAVVGGFMGSAATSLVAPLTLDTMILTQWLSRFTVGASSRRRDYYTPSSAITSCGKLYFVPSASAQVSALVSFLNTSTTLFKHVYGGTFADIASAEAHVADASAEGQNWGIIDVRSMTADNFDVDIRLNHTSMPQTSSILNKYYLGGLTQDNGLYILDGFSTLQNVISQFYLQQVVGATGLPSAPPLTAPMGYGQYDTQDFLAFGGALAPLIIVLGFLYPVSQLTKRLVLEKETRIREAMMIMGLGRQPFYWSWICVYSAQQLIISIILTIILKHTYCSKANNGALFFCFFFFQLSTVTLSGLISSFFSKARLAALIAPLVYVAIAVPLFAIQSASSGLKGILLVLSPTAFAEGIQLLFDHELAGGLGSSDVRSSQDSPNMLAVLFLLAIDTIAYFLLWVYIDMVMPNDWGTTMNAFFCCINPIKWLFAERHETELLDDGRSPTGVYEPIAVTEKTTVQLVGLRKEFQRGGKPFVAVNNLYWSLNEGEISVLLGHNGAGKSTTMNLMTGMLEADGGDCFIYGHSVKHELDQVRHEIGYCPQHNILWPELTCEEHLYFFASIKGLEGAERENAVTTMLDAVDLTEKRFALSSSLSGGQKRKLSVAIAFVGGSRLIFLDEPTAGMDVGARRHTWDLLKRMSADRTILLTTHFMDEADLLGHRVAIMNDGALQCSGSSLFLKSRLGVGYNIVLSVEAHADASRIENEVRSFVPEAELLTHGAGELCFRLPNAAVSRFPSLMGHLEENGHLFGSRNFSIAATTLEEIFLQIAQGSSADTIHPKTVHATPLTGGRGGSTIHEVDADGREVLLGERGGRREEPSAFKDVELLDSSSSITRAKNRSTGSSTRPSPASDTNAPNHVKIPAPSSSNIWNVRRMELNSTELFLSQLAAQLKKRFRNSTRDRRTQCLQIVAPVVCILLAMLFTLINLFNAPALVLNSSLYPGTVDITLSQNCSSLLSTYGLSYSSNAQILTPVDVVNSLNLTNWLVDSAYAHGSTGRYGALSCLDSRLSTAINLNSVNDANVIFYNSSSFHELPIGLANYYNSLYKKAKQSSQANMNLRNFPMPKTKREAAYADSIKSIMIGIIIMIPFTFIPSTFVSWIVKERECKARHLQNVSGLRFSVYWLSNFLFDTASFIVTMFLVIAVFGIFNRQEYIGTSSIGATIVLFFMYGLSGVAFAYLTSFLFNEHSTAQNIVMLANFIAGFLLVLLVFILSLVDSTKSAANVLAYIFRVVPSYCLGDGIINLAILQAKQAYGSKSKAFDLDIVGWDLIYMGIEFPLVMLITLFIDHPTRRMRTQSLLHDPDATPEVIPNEDEDVKREREEIETMDGRASDLVVVRNLRKQYSNGKVAVKNLSFGVHPGEVFGFLGTNGAGKTTTISILCQEFFPSSGHAFVAGKDIVKEANEALKFIGYCPQFDALLDLLTVEEHLYLYAGVRGIVHEDRQRVVESLAALCELTMYLPTVAMELSGGNKRKLSVALSLIGGPSVVFLDEPSAGMDPVARRGLWTAVETVADNCAVVLTTHHLEEVEALAHRVAIMVDGALHCIGDKLHLKTKYGSGFEMSVRIASASDSPKFEEFMRTRLPGATLNEFRSLRYTYAIPQTSRLSQVFALLEHHKPQLNITDYTVSQTSIEQVFLRISAEAEHNDEQ